MMFCKFYCIYKLKWFFIVLKTNSTTKASKFMSEDQFDVWKGPNLKMQFKRAFQMPKFR